MFDSDSLAGVQSYKILLTGHLWEEHGGALTRLKTKLQVVFSDDENGHGFDKKEESKSNAERTLASFLQLEVVGR